MTLELYAHLIQSSSGNQQRFQRHFILDFRQGVPDNRPSPSTQLSRKTHGQEDWQGRASVLQGRCASEPVAASVHSVVDEPHHASLCIAWQDCLYIMGVLMQIGLVAVLATLSYLLGALPTAFLVAKAHGIDIRTVGSGNVGATNVFRALGKWWGLLTFTSDFLKGFIPALVFPLIGKHWLGYEGQSVYLGLVCSALAIAGHNWPAYLHFKGGKGVATSAGALLGLAPLAGVVGLGAWLLVFLLTRYVSLASIIAALAITISAWILYLDQGPVLPGVLTVLAGILILRHHSNIKRLMLGTENRIEFRKKSSGVTSDQ